MSSPQPDLVVDPIVDTHNPEHYKIGTLNYTKAGLFALGFYLLWGDFCFCLMETVMPSLLPPHLVSLGASNKMIGLIMITIPSVMTLLINPVVSFRSDRFRSKWGRRIPFLAVATPFVSLFLILLAYAEPVSRFIHRTVFAGKYSDLTVLLVIICGMMIVFQLFNSVIQSIYYYLFNDVVPRAFLARIMSLFRIVGSLAGMFYNACIFPYSESRVPEIFIGAGLLYLIGFGVMCAKVKEGKYPPPPENVGNQPGVIGSILTYAEECFTHRFYWLLFAANACWAMTWVSGPFSIPYQTQVLGYDRAFIGHVGAITGGIGIVLLFPAGMLADRFHPLRVMLLGIAGALVFTPFDILFAFMRPALTLHTAQMITIALSAIKLPIGVMASAGEVALFMRILPQDRYGQFCSANALIRSLALVIGGLACGVFLDYVKTFNPNPDLCFRFVPVWNGVFQFGYVLFYYLLYLEWNRLGGLANFVPPSAKPPASVLAAFDQQRTPE